MQQYKDAKRNNSINHCVRTSAVFNPGDGSSGVDDDNGADVEDVEEFALFQTALSKNSRLGFAARFGLSEQADSGFFCFGFT